MGRVLGALAVVLLCAACGRVELKTADETPAIVPTTAPESTSAPATGPCQVEEHVPEPVTPQPPGPSLGVQPDVAPHNAENNGWKQRKPLNALGVQAGRDTVARIRPLLEQVCASGDFSVDGTKKALTGYDAYVVRDYPDQAFVGYTITVSNGPSERVTCVLGDLAPGLVRVFLDGTTGEGSCYEPKSH
ncbi:hypothetical protein ABZX92_37155 [Lentzea sp. NPDC006480]|uniref:hypothetical protein n=1 Tax=Lentzea sp. NPDC006480 TaxID=3157176 RepID=UPI0033AF9BA9